MKQLYTLVLLVFVTIVANRTSAQKNWVKIDEVMNVYTSKGIIIDQNVYHVFQNGSAIDVRKKNSWNANFQVIATDVTDGESIDFFMPINYNGDLAILFKTYNSAIELHVYDGFDFNLVGTPFFVPYLGYDICYLKDPNDPAAFYIAVSKYDDVLDQEGVYVYHYDGTDWNTLVESYNPIDPDAYLSTPQIHIANDVFYMAVKVSDEIPHPIYVSSSPLASLSSASFTPITTSDYFDFTFDVKMKGEVNQLPYFVISEYDSLCIAKLDPTGTIDLAKIYTGLTYGSYEFEVVNNKVYFATQRQIDFISDLSAFVWDETQMIFDKLAHDTTIYSTNYSYLNSFFVSNDGNRFGLTYSYYDTGYDYSDLYVTNTLPEITLVDNANLCEGIDSTNVAVIKKILFSDFEGDFANIDSYIESSDETVMFGYSNLYALQLDSIENSFEIIASSFQLAGTTNLNFQVFDGYESTIFTLPVTVNGTPTSPITSNQIVACINDDEIDLNDFVGGALNTSFFYAEEELVTGVFDPSSYTGSIDDKITVFFEDNSTGCSLNDYFNVIINNPSQIEIATTASSCANNSGSATLTILSGPQPHYIYWTTGVEQTNTINDLTPGQYFVNVTNADGCLAVAPVNIESTETTVTPSITNVACHGGQTGAISLAISGPDAPYTLLWNTGHSSTSINSLTAGVYDVVIKGNSGCEFSRSFEVTQPNRIRVNYDNVSYVQPDCGMSNGEITPVVTGGTGALTYNWTSAGNQSTLTATNLPAGIHRVLVGDASGCTRSFEFTLNNEFAMSFAAEVSRPTCNSSNGFIRVVPEIAWNVQSIEWSNGVTGRNNNSIGVGNYTCELTDYASCKTFRKWSLTSQEPLRNEICLLTVDSATTTNLVVWEKEQNFGISHYNIYRESSVAGQYMVIDTVSGLNMSVFNDVVASPKNRSWRYKISAVDQCGVEGPLSAAHKTVHLVINKINATDYRINWDNYEGIDNGALYLFRYTATEGWVELGNYPIIANSFIDTPPSEDEIDYIVEIRPSEICTADKAQDYNSSRSNKANSVFNPGEGTGDSNNSIAENNSSLPITIYPNPSEGNVTFVNEDNHVTSVMLYNTSGALADSFDFTSAVSKQFGHLQSGVYYIKISSEGIEVVKKLILY